MFKLRFKISMSLDGFVAGPDQSVDNPLGIGGMRLHEWVFPLAAWRSNRRGTPPEEKTFRSPAERKPLNSSSWPASWTRWRSTLRRRSSAAVSVCSTASATICMGSSWCAPSPRRM